MKISKHISKKLQKMIADSGWNISLAISNEQYGGFFWASTEDIITSFETYLETGENTLGRKLDGRVK